MRNDSRAPATKLPNDELATVPGGNAVTVTHSAPNGHSAAADEILHRLSAIELDTGYDQESLPPTSAALDAARSLFDRALGGWIESTPEPSLGPIGDGGLAIRWRRGDRDESLTIPPDGLRRAHLYCADSSGDSIIRPVTPARLTDRLRWLVFG